MAEYMLTTVDNPYNPSTEFNAWRAFDERNKYFTLSLLARVAKVSDELSDADMNQAIDDAINEIVDENVSGMHRKVLVGT